MIVEIHNTITSAMCVCVHQLSIREFSGSWTYKTTSVSLFVVIKPISLSLLVKQIKTTSNLVDFQHSVKLLISKFCSHRLKYWTRFHWRIFHCLHSLQHEIFWFYDFIIKISNKINFISLIHLLEIFPIHKGTYKKNVIHTFFYGSHLLYTSKSCTNFRVFKLTHLGYALFPLRKLSPPLVLSLP